MCMSVFVDVGDEHGPTEQGWVEGEFGLWWYTQVSAHHIGWSGAGWPSKLSHNGAFAPLITAWRQPATGKGCDLEKFSWRVRPQRRKLSWTPSAPTLKQLGECQGSLRPLLHQLIEMTGLRSYNGGKASWPHGGFLEPQVWLAGWGRGEAMTVPLVCFAESGVEVGWGFWDVVHQNPSSGFLDSNWLANYFESRERVGDLRFEFCGGGGGDAWGRFSEHPGSGSPCNTSLQPRGTFWRLCAWLGGEGFGSFLRRFLFSKIRTPLVYGCNWRMGEFLHLYHPRCVHLFNSCFLRG